MVLKSNTVASHLITMCAAMVIEPHLEFKDTPKSDFLISNERLYSRFKGTFMLIYLILSACSETLHPELHQPLSTRSSIISRAKLSFGIQAKASLMSSCKGFTLKAA